MLKRFKTPKQIGELIKSVRKEMGWSQEWVGKLIGVTQEQVAKYERGINALSTKRINDVIKYLGPESGISLYDFITDNKEDK